MNLAKIAVRYATALLESAEAQSAVDSVKADLSDLKTLYTDSVEFKSLIHSPTIQLAEKEKMILETFKNVNGLTLTFLRLLVRKNRLDLLLDCVSEFERLIDLKSGIVHAVAISAESLSVSQLTAIKDNLESQLKKTVMLRTEIESSIIGGYVVRINDTMIDHSIKNQLAKLKESLLAG